MFEKNDRCITFRIGEEVPEDLQRLIWDILGSFVKSRKSKEVDYLQIFKLLPVEINGHRMQKVIHTQEHPPFMEMTIFEVRRPIESTVFAYLESDRTTLMLSDDN